MSAPSFAIIITEKYLYRSWYTLDNGATNITFTGSITIAQDIWDALADDAELTIKIYAEDKPGHISSIEITIIKCPPEEPDNTALIITIIVLSVVGGLVITISVIWVKNPEAIKKFSGKLRGK